MALSHFCSGHKIALAGVSGNGGWATDHLTWFLRVRCESVSQFTGFYILRTEKFRVACCKSVSYLALATRAWALCIDERLIVAFFEQVYRCSGLDTTTQQSLVVWSTRIIWFFVVLSFKPLSGCPIDLIESNHSKIMVFFEKPCVIKDMTRWCSWVPRARHGYQPCTYRSCVYSSNTTSPNTVFAWHDGYT